MRLLVLTVLLGLGVASGCQAEDHDGPRPTGLVGTGGAGSRVDPEVSATGGRSSPGDDPALDPDEDLCLRPEVSVWCLDPYEHTRSSWAGGASGLGGASGSCPKAAELTFGVCAVLMCSESLGTRIADEVTQCCYETLLIHCR